MFSIASSYLRSLIVAPLALALFIPEPAQPKDRAPARRERSKPHDVLAGVPFILDSQRVLVEVAFETPDGGARNALVWFNMGMADPVLTQSLYRELAIDKRQTLRIFIGDKTIEAAANEIADGDGGIGVPTFSHLFAPRPVEAMLPARLLQNYAVTLDYGRRTFALTAPGSLKPDGVAIPCLVNPRTGVVAVEADIAGTRYPLAIDAGSGYSWLRGDVAREWLARHPDWRRAEGAVGQANANMIDFAFEKEGVVFRIPQISLGALQLDNVGALGTAPILGGFGQGLFGDLFWDNWRKAAPTPVIGWLGGNILKDYKLTIDYDNGLTYWRKQKAPDSHDLDQPGLTLVRRDQRYFVSGIVRKAYAGGVDAPTVVGAQIGDELVTVNGVTVRGLGKDDVLSALHGKPGETRQLGLERSGAPIKIDVLVSTFE